MLFGSANGRHYFLAINDESITYIRERIVAELRNYDSKISIYADDSKRNVIKIGVDACKGRSHTHDYR